MKRTVWCSLFLVCGLLVAFSIGPVTAGSPTWTVTGSLNDGRHEHTATLLLDGRVLAFGGGNQEGDPSATAELYDPAVAQWTLTGSLNHGRVGHVAAPLLDGSVLVAGGHDGSSILAAAELYDPVTGQWVVTGAMNTPRISALATLLLDGKVLVVGGHDGDDKVASAELYDPATGQWTLTGSLAIGRTMHTATLLLDGKVLVVGGHDGDDYVASAELYDPGSGEWTPAGSLQTARTMHTATRLADGRVLVTGGQDVVGPLVTSELYNPTTGQWTMTGDLNTPRNSHSATLLPDGDVLVAGGYMLSSAELYNPATGTWTATASMQDARYRHRATLLLDGRVLVAGGFYWPDVLTSAEIYDPLANVPPVAVDDAYEGTEDTLLAVVVPGVLLNDTDSDGDPLSAILDTPPGGGTLALNADGSFTYMPADGFVGAVTFTYHAYDGEASSNIAVVTLTIAPGHRPAAVDDSYTALIDTLLVVPVPGVLANDTDPDGDALTAVLEAAPPIGALTLSANGSFSYVPQLGFTGAVTFTYHAYDGDYSSNIAAVTIRVIHDNYVVYLPLIIRE